MEKDIISKKLKFLDEIEKFACIKRKIWKSNGEAESDSDHSWFLAMFVMVFKEEIMESSSGLDYTKMLEMCLVHDLPEIYSGDVFPFSDDFDKSVKEESEKLAAEKLFDLLDGDLKKKFVDLYGEYEEMETFESKIIKALDKIQPDHLNLLLKGANWEKYDITFTKLKDYKDVHVSKNSFTKKLYYDFILSAGLDKGYLKK